METSLNLDYCYKICSVGKKAAAEFLDKNNSAYDAAIDFWSFTDECFKNCPYKDEHKKELEK
jgi:hypothetical protein